MADFGDLLPGLSPLFGLDFIITRDDDWHDLLPQFLIGGAPFDLSGMSVDLWVRPIFGHPTTMLHLTQASGSGDGILYDDASASLMTIQVSRATVDASLPAGKWSQFAVLTDPSRRYGWNTREIWRGSLTVLPGLIGA
jgi:hypothetical protein